MPPAEWLCPECVRLARRAPDGPQPVRPAPHAALFPNAATRKRDEEARKLNNARALRAGTAGRGRQPVGEQRWGTLQFRGPLARPFYFMLEWDGEAGAEAVLLAEAQRLAAAARAAAGSNAEGAPTPGVVHGAAATPGAAVGGSAEGARAAPAPSTAAGGSAEGARATQPGAAQDSAPQTPPLARRSGRPRR